jgi:hypothetical protein
MAAGIEKIIATVLDEATHGRSKRSWRRCQRDRRGSTDARLALVRAESTPVIPSKGELATLGLPPVLAVDKPSDRKHPGWIGG